jgi:hypothetical protein
MSSCQVVYTSIGDIQNAKNFSPKGELHTKRQMADMMHEIDM